MSKRHAAMIDLLLQLRASEFTAKELAALLEMSSLRIGTDKLLESLYRQKQRTNGLLPDMESLTA